MAAYGALVSLMNTMHHIQNHPLFSISLDKSLGEKVDFLLDFIENYSHGASKEAQVLESEIASVATSAEDVIESRIVHHIQKETSLTSLTNREKEYNIKRRIISINLKRSIEEMDSIKKRVIEIKGKMGIKDQQPPTWYSTSSSTPGKRAMVGFDDDLLRLMDALTGPQPDRLVLSIVGMGGIGKTTLARNLYEHPFIVHHFDILAWVTVSQQYCVREIFLKLLSCQGKSFTSEMDGKDEDELGEYLHKSLFGMRYLIVLDDVWSIDAWDKVNRFLPDNNDNKSRVIVTTRLSNMANLLGPWCHAMSLLDDDKSWKLFCQNAFGQEEGCPPELEEIGKKILRKCKGLPLSIVVIGGLLGKSYKTREYWENVANDENSILDSDAQSLDILSLSYNHLPAHLKPCFLYMGVFPEDHEIHVSQLIKLWVAEGFMKPNAAHTLEEEVAEAYLKDLIDRNLILVRKLASNGKIKTCSIHDLLRDLCLKVAQKEKFLCVGMVSDFRRGKNKKRHLRVIHSLADSASFTRSLVRKRGRLSFKFTLLRILNMGDSDYSLDGILRQANLRYMCKLYSSKPGDGTSLPSIVSLLWNLQTIIIKGKEQFIAAFAIWNMPQLRHLDFPLIYLPEPPPLSHQEDHLVLRNLQTLQKAVDFVLSEDVCKRIPNVNKLKIQYWILSEENSSHYYFHNLALLHKLESLSFSFEWLNRDYLQPNLNLPHSLKKLSLTNYKLRWEDLTLMGSLPHLEVLKLMGIESVSGNEWSPVEGEFLCLKFLGIYYSSDLMYWNADNAHFPVLEKLILHGMFNLDEIPSGIGEIPTLGLIELDGCSESAAISALQILKEQESFGNEGLQVRVKFLDKAKLERFKEEVTEQFGSFPSSYFLQTTDRFS